MHAAQDIRSTLDPGRRAVGHPAGTVITGVTCPPLGSVRVNRNIRNENTPFEYRSRSSI
jgi:hypothetical protein